MKHYSEKISIKIKDGFTLIETLVAIAVLMIAIAGPLTIANKALTSALYSRDQSIASNLAQESMEIIKNVRDNNIVVGNDFLAGLTGCLNSGRCDAGTNKDGPDPEVSCSDQVNGCLIYLSDINGYNHDNDGTPTLFSRHFVLTPIGADSSDYQVTVFVDWKEGTTPNQISLHSELVNATR
ncbi:MAG: prepilin-type N-terminal cleavage/methylation domain-containing protein [Candidatus Taylorbacteria bacterium]